jgi:hypothetical protein
MKKKPAKKPAKPKPEDNSREDLRDMLTRIGLNQRGLATMLGVDKMTVWRWLSAEIGSGHERPIPHWVYVLLLSQSTLRNVRDFIQKNRDKSPQAVLDAIEKELDSHLT